VFLVDTVKAKFGLEFHFTQSVLGCCFVDLRVAVYLKLSKRAGFFSVQSKLFHFLS